MNDKHSGKSFIITLILAAFGLTFSAQAEEDPSPELVMEAVRESTSRTKEHTLEGRLRRYETGKKFPFKMTVRGPQISFMFTGKPPQIIVLDLKEKGVLLRESINGGKYKPVPLSAYGNDIRGTGINYVDISMTFLYWPNPKFEAHDRVGDRLAWRVSVKNPGKSGPYARMRVWVDKNTGALLRIQGMNTAGKVIKQMEVRDVKKVRGVWTLKRMDIIGIDPVKGRAVSRTHMEF